MNQILLHGLNLNELLSAIEKLIDDKLGSKQQLIKEQTVYLTRKEVAKLLRVTLPTLHDYTKLGWIKSYKIGNRVLYKEVDVHNAVAKIASVKHKKGLTG